MGTLRGEEIIARCFQREGVDTIFFMMGGPTGGTAGACLELGMKGIYVRHEQAAAMMAHAYSRVTGKPGICIAPMGPGVANLVTGLANAWADAVADYRDRRLRADARRTTLDTFQEMDQVPMMRPIVKSAYRVDLGYRIPEYISIAFREALDGKRGPIYLDLPGDILSGKVEEEKIHWVEGNYRTDARPAGDPALIRRAVELLARARKPLILTGSGVFWSGAEKALQDFVEATGIPFFTTPQGRGVIAEDHPALVPGGALDRLSRGRCGARDWRAGEFDALFPTRPALLARRQVHQRQRRRPRDRSQSRRRNRDHRRRQARPAAACAPRPRAASTGKTETTWVAQLAAKHRSNLERSAPLLHSDKTPIHPLRLCNEVKDVISRDTILVVDGHEILNFARQSIPVYQRAQQPQRGPARMHGRRHPVRDRRARSRRLTSRSWC